MESRYEVRCKSNWRMSAMGPTAASLAVSRTRPLIPHKQHQSGHSGTSYSCHYETKGTAAKIGLEANTGRRGSKALIKTLIAAVTLAHSWYPPECCKEKDCHPLPCSELSVMDNLIRWRGKVIGNRRFIRTSQDELCHICLTGPRQIPLCVFMPEGVS
jgi:hypothetical protein